MFQGPRLLKVTRSPDLTRHVRENPCVLSYSLDFVYNSGLIENEFQNRKSTSGMGKNARYRCFSTALTVLVAVAVTAATAAAALPQEDVRRVLTLLSAAGEDYREGVRDGAVVRPIEWEEAKAFLQDARERWQKIASQSPDSDLTSVFEVTARAVEYKAAAEQVAAQLAALTQSIVSISGISEEVYPPKTPSAARGQALFADYCASCHGQHGDGKGPSAAWLNPPPASFADAQFMRGETPYDFYHVISLGKRGTAMPAWDQSLSVQDRWDLVSYVWTLVLGDAGIAEGQGVYLAHCASCHGATGDGQGEFKDVLLKSAPDITRPEALARRTDAELFAAASNGIAGSPMPAFAPTLSEDERWKAIAFMRLLSLGALPVHKDAPKPLAPVLLPSRAADVQPSTSDAALAQSARLLDAGVSAYGRGDAQASATVADAYMQFEPLEKHVSIAAPGLTERTEEHFLRLRQMLRAPGNGAAVHALAELIHADLAAVRTAMEPRTNPYALFAESATIILREGFEMVLVVGALVAYVLKTRNAAMQRSIYAGVIFAMVASLATALIMGELIHLHPAASDVLEGATMLIAAVVLFWVSYWLISKSESAKWQRYIQGRMQTALRGGSSVALASAAFLAVYREGFEMVLFYQALYASAPTGSVAISLGLIAGAIALAVIYVVLRRFQLQIPIRQFFFATGLFLYLMAAVFSGQGVHELQGAGLITMTPLAWVPAIPFIGVYPSVETLAAQAVFVGLLLYATAVSFWRARRLAPTHETADALTELRTVSTAIEGLRQELKALRLSGAPTPIASLGQRLEALLVRIEELSARVTVKVPANGGTNRGNE